MTTEIKDQILQKLLEYMQESKDFLIEQAPDVVQQIFRYHLYTAWVELCICLSIGVLLLSVNLYIYLYPTLDSHGDRDLLSFFGAYMPMIFAIPLIAMSWACMDKLMKIYLAPKYFIINLIMSMKG